MKRTILLLAIAIVILSGVEVSAQTFPYGINYQAVARDANGNAQINQQVPIQFSIYQVTANGTLVWQERQVKTTNSMGQFNAIIGTGTPVTPFNATSFSQINWGSDSTFLKVELNANISFTGVFSTIGASTKFQSVPYALLSNKSDTANVAKMGLWNDYGLFQENLPNNTVSSNAYLLNSTWQTFVLNTTSSSAGNSISRSGNVITLAPGRYHVTASSRIGFGLTNSNGAFFNIRFRNMTSGSTSIIGQGWESNASGNLNIYNSPSIEGIFDVVGTSQTFELQYYLEQSVAGTLYVWTCRIANDGENELVTNMLIQRIR